jgi:UDP-glucose 4-epimerase
MKTEASHLVLVTGASGWIGQEVCRRLTGRGLGVVAFGRAAVAGPGIEFIGGTLDDFRDPNEALFRMLARTDAIIHCAGRAHRPVETAAEIEAFAHTNIRGTEAVVSACTKAGVQRLVYVSTIAAYDWTAAPKAGVKEDATLYPKTAYAKTKLEGEQRVRDSGLDWRAVRLSTVFGEGDRANFARLAAALKRGRFIVPGKDTARKSVIPVGLAAELLVRLAIEPLPRHRLVNAAVPEVPTLREICDAFSETCEFPRARSLPLSALKAGAILGDVVGRVRPGFPLTSANLGKLTTATVIDSSRMYETFPDFPRTTFAEALKSAADYYRQVS